MNILEIMINNIFILSKWPFGNRILLYLPLVIINQRAPGWIIKNLIILDIYDIITILIPLILWTLYSLLSYLYIFNITFGSMITGIFNVNSTIALRILPFYILIFILFYIFLYLNLAGFYILILSSRYNEWRIYILYFIYIYSSNPSNAIPIVASLTGAPEI